MKMGRALLLLCCFFVGLFWGVASRADDIYAFAKYGKLTLSATHPNITSIRQQSNASEIGIGWQFSRHWAGEFAFHDLGTYRFTAEKHVSIYPGIGFDAPGYGELRASGQSLGLRYTRLYFTAKAAALNVHAEGELHTPIGYMMAEKNGVLPMAEIGLTSGGITLEYMVAPKLSGVFLGVKLGF